MPQNAQYKTSNQYELYKRHYYRYIIRSIKSQNIHMPIPSSSGIHNTPILQYICIKIPTKICHLLYYIHEYITTTTTTTTIIQQYLMQVVIKYQYTILVQQYVILYCIRMVRKTFLSSKQLLTFKKENTIQAEFRKHFFYYYSATTSLIEQTVHMLARYELVTNQYELWQKSVLTHIKFVTNSLRVLQPIRNGSLRARYESVRTLAKIRTDSQRVRNELVLSSLRISTNFGKNPY
eukprot:TRINITY_DN9040_c0_g1_i1.p2 TRINITY_DN9040_c0_g1~~TRINITY_DN9040_c0_g1_i1.p2  ORF type:complete len:235 (-),score=-19.73 TRINITY_DN9040_c0_g1_i1:53-757(-)